MKETKRTARARSKSTGYFKKSQSMGSSAGGDDNAISQYSMQTVEDSIRRAVASAVEEEFEKRGNGSPADWRSSKSVGGGAAPTDLEERLTGLEQSTARIEVVLANLRDKLQVKRKNKSGGDD